MAQDPFQRVPGIVDGRREGVFGREAVGDAQRDGVEVLDGVDAARSRVSAPRSGPRFAKEKQGGKNRDWQWRRRALHGKRKESK